VGRAPFRFSRIRRVAEDACAAQLFNVQQRRHADQMFQERVLEFVWSFMFARRQGAVHLRAWADGGLKGCLFRSRPPS
jgi:hypothetical protein